MEREELRCVIAAGGTAGHVLPALAVAEALEERGVRVTFAGPPRPETRIVTEAGYETDPFEVRGIPRELSRRTLSALRISGGAPAACTRILARRRPHVVLGAGGYVAGPMVLAAWLRRIPAALTEADAVLGLANRLAAPLARRVFLAYPVSGRDGDRYRVVGRPVPRRSLPPPGGREEGRRRFQLPADGRVVAVVGGSQGARRLNEAAVDELGAGAAADDGLPAVLHLCGTRDYADLEPRVVRPGYRLLPFTDEFGAALAAADLVVSRSGGAVWEIAAAARAALLVPYPYATADHQTANARYFERAGGAVVVSERELRLGPRVEGLLADPERLRRMGEAMRAVARPHAGEAIADELVRLAVGEAAP